MWRLQTLSHRGLPSPVERRSRHVGDVECSIEQVVNTFMNGRFDSKDPSNCPHQLRFLWHCPNYRWRVLYCCIMYQFRILSNMADMSGEEEPDAAHLCNDGCSHQSQNISWRNKSQLFEKLIRVPVTSQSRGLCLEKTTLDDKWMACLLLSIQRPTQIGLGCKVYVIIERWGWSILMKRMEFLINL